jgi:hypothetical protein
VEPVVIKFTVSRDERVRLKKAALDAGHLRTGDYIRSLIRNAIPDPQPRPAETVKGS